MKRIVLVRHATAVDVGPKGSDFHRRLKKRGRREASRTRVPSISTFARSRTTWLRCWAKHLPPL
jgi:hypothetical protein